MNAVVTMRQIDGSGTVFVDESGGVIALSDSCLEVFDAAAAMGITPDELVTDLLNQAEQGRAMGIVVPEPVRAEVPMRPIYLRGVRAPNVCRRAKRLRHRERFHKRYS